MRDWGILKVIKNNDIMKEEICDCLNKMNTNPSFWEERKQRELEKCRERQKALAREMARRKRHYIRVNFKVIDPEVCTVCKERYPRTSKYWHRGNSFDGLRRVCKVCKNEDARKRRIKYKEDRELRKGWLRA